MWQNAVRMPLLLSIFAQDVLPIFVIAGVGYLLARRLGADVRTLSRVSFNALAPCLVFTLIVSARITPQDFGRMALFTVLVVLGIGGAAWLVTRPLGLDRATLTAFLMVVMFSNNGNYGLPLVLFAFGQEALAQAGVYFVTSAVLTYTLGVFLAASGRRSLASALAGVLRVPPVYGVAAAGLVLATGARVPVFVMRPIQLLYDAAIPVMMLVLGMQLERATRPERPGLVCLAAGLSLLVTPLIALAVAHLLALGVPARQAGIVESSMPSAVVTTILALEYDAAPAFVTGVVFLSTLLSPLTVTLLIAWLK